MAGDCEAYCLDPRQRYKRGMIRYLDVGNRRLAEYRAPGAEVDWDSIWLQRDPTIEAAYPGTRRIVELTRHHLPQGARVVDGGCGIADKVYALQAGGFEAWGVDLAQQTLRRVHAGYPNLRLVTANVLRMPFPDGFFQGYWSLGVIEHFENGFGAVLDETARVLAADGCLFLSVPVMSPLRNLRARRGAYPLLDQRRDDGLVFWQFLLDPDELTAEFSRRGFQLVEMRPQGGFYGIKDELGPIRPMLDRIGQAHRIAPARLVIRALNLLCRRFAAHTALFVFRRG